MKLRENMHMIFEIFRRDLLGLLRNPLATIVVLGVCLMPSLYAWYTIAANWDPYQNTNSIKVAVANLDEGAESDLAGKIDVGKEVVDELHEDHNLGWEFVSEDEAMDGVESGKYYAAIVIPEHFSADFLSVFSGKFTRPVLDYYVNEKISAVVPKITDTGANTIENQINASFVETVSKAVMTITQKVGGEVESDSSDAAGSLTRGVENARDAIGQTQQTLSDTAPTFDAVQASLSDAQVTLSTLGDALPQLVSSLGDAQQTLSSMRDEVGTYGDKIASDATSAASEVSAAAAQANIAIASASAKLAAGESAINAALSDAQKILAENQSIIDELEPYAQTHPEIASIVAELQSENENLEQTVAALQTLSSRVGQAASAAVAAATQINDEAQAAASEISSLASDLQKNILPAVEKSLDDFSTAIGILKGVTTALEPDITQGQQTLDALSLTITQAQQTITFATDSLGTVTKNLENSLTDLKALQDSQSVKSLSEYLDLSPSEVGSFMSSPVELKTVDVYPVKNYGSGVAPFYTNLALWVAGFILVAIIHLWVDPKGLGRFNVTQAYLGRWLLFMLLGIIQGLIVCVGDLVLGIQCENPAAFIFAGLVTVFVDVNIMYALVFTMRHLGRAIGVILLIMQIPGSSGEYPVEMMPPFFQAIHPFLPFTYSIDAMREAIGGMYDGHYAMDLAALVPFLVIALVFGLVVGRYAFNVNALFDRKLSQTNLFICEAPGTLRERFRLRTMLRALLDVEAFREALTQRVSRFRKNYPRLIRVGWAAVGLLLAATLALALAVDADNEVKVVLLVCMVAGIFLVGGYLIIVEYLNTSFGYQLEISGMSAAVMKQHVDEAQYVDGDDSAGAFSDSAAPEEGEDWEGEAPADSAAPEEEWATETETPEAKLLLENDESDGEGSDHA